MSAPLPEGGSSFDLCDLIDRERATILEEWESRVRTQLIASPRSHEPALRGALPELLTWIGAAVRTGEIHTPRTGDDLRRAHARWRFDEGYDLSLVVRELSILRGVILELWSRACSDVRIEDVARLNEAVDRVVARSASAFAEAQQKELRRRLDAERRLIGVVSHDLRNPLHRISLATHVLSRQLLTAAGTRAVVRIRNAEDEAQGLVRDLLDFTTARLGTGIPVDRRVADLHEIVGRVVEEEASHAGGLRLVHEREGDGTALLDADRLVQATRNLVSNAVKHGPSECPVTVRTEGDIDAVRLSVHNAGPPIPKAEQAHLFEPLRQGPSGRFGGGIGLGLFIVKSIARAHGGSVTVTSTPEDGTRFTVTLPRVPPEEGPSGVVFAMEGLEEEDEEDESGGS